MIYDFLPQKEEKKKFNTVYSSYLWWLGYWTNLSTYFKILKKVAHTTCRTEYRINFVFWKPKEIVFEWMGMKLWNKLKILS